MKKVYINAIILSLSILIFLFLSFFDASARSKKKATEKEDAESIYDQKKTLPNAQQRVHRVPDVRVCMTNWGLLGSQMRYLNESMGGCFNPNPGEELPAPSFEYPPGSGLEYLFQGSIWIGAKIDDAIYTSVGCDGWFWIYELWPDPGYPGAIRERSTRGDVVCYSPDAISEQDIIAVYTDTSADIPLSPDCCDEWDERKHFPLGIIVTQKSYSWDTEGWDKFIIAEYILKNIGVNLLSDIYVGFFVDGDAMHIDEDQFGPFGPQDDITGFLQVYEEDTVNIAWIADNDGHGIAGELLWTEKSPRSVLGVKVLHTPSPDMQISYNWWVSNSSGYPKDWGPWKASNQDVWEAMNPYGSGNLFPDGVLGTPGGDVSKYFIMSNGEIDYDQIFSCAWPDEHPDEGWLPPSPECPDIANGYDIRFLLSFGPFDQLDPGDSLTFAVAYVIGETLHVDPLNLVNDPNMSDPLAYYENLYFGDLVNNALTAESLYYDILFNYPPDSFALLSPPNKAFTPRVVHFDWETATDPDPGDQVTYDLYVSKSYHDFLDSATIYSNLVVSEHFKKLDYGTYYWRVKARDNHGAERWSNQMGYFMVTGVQPLPVGDLNRDGFTDVGDVVFAINYLYRSGSAPDPLKSGDVNCDDVVDIGDAVFLINYLFRSGPSPECP